MAKKIISILAVMALLVCSFSVAVFADDYTAEDIATDLEKEKVATECTRGDMDDDGDVTSADARFALRMSLGFEDAGLVEDAAKRGDFDLSGKIDSADARLILRASVGLETIGHDVATATWTKGAGDECYFCGAEIEGEKALIAAMIDDANEWAETAGLDQLISGSYKADDDASEIVLGFNVDWIWDHEAVADNAFDGFLTAIGNYVKENIGAAVITLDGKEIYADGAMHNHAVKEALFDLGDGFFFKWANMTAENGEFVYGEYDVDVDGEAVKLSVVFSGKDENLAKIADMCEVVSDHVYAVKGDYTDLVIGVDAPDALVETIAEKGGMEALAALTVGKGFDVLAAADINDVLGSQVSAVEKLCKTVCGFEGLINKVYGKFSDVTVKDAEGNEIALFADDAAFAAPETGDFNGLVKAVSDMFSDELKACEVGSFKYVADDTANEFGTGYYEVPVSFKVNVSNAGLLDGNGGIIEETVIVRIHVG